MKVFERMNGERIFNMRSCVANSQWEKITNKKSNNNFLSIDFNQFHGIKEKLNLPSNGVIAFCGLNGVGKSTLLSIVKKLVGVNLYESETAKVDSTKIKAMFNYNNTEIELDSLNKTITETTDISDKFIFVDYDKVNNCHNKLLEDSDIEDYLLQNEFIKLEKNDISELNAIIGKNYSEIQFCELDYSDDISIPFFKIKESVFSYDTLKMGKGEYFIIYLFWVLKNLKNNSTLILDEPENGISISSQKHLMDYLALCVNEKKINLIITTHSPFILERIPLDSIRIVSRESSVTSIIQPKSILTITSHLDLEADYDGILLVEDQTAKDFLCFLLESFNQDLLSKFEVSIAEGGDSSIGEILKASYKIKNNPFKIYGVFDGDDRNNENYNKLNNSFFLPGDLAFEGIFENYIEDEKNRKKVAKYLGINYDQFVLSINKHKGEDYHDYYINLFKDFHLNGKYFIQAYCNTISKKEQNKLKAFVDTLDFKIKNNSK